MSNDYLRAKKILIVEDDLSSRLYLNKILEKTGAYLLNASDGSEAISAVETDPDIELILLDIQLPVIDGYGAAKKIRELRSDVVIIAQTAFSLMGDKEKIISSGFDDYITKPIFPQQLIEKLEKAVRKNSAV
jgi:CheY-like chemotaxis protein